MYSVLSTRVQSTVNCKYSEKNVIFYEKHNQYYILVEYYFKIWKNWSLIWCLIGRKFKAF